VSNCEGGGDTDKHLTQQIILKKKNAKVREVVLVTILEAITVI
jgi:hypothetical protein